MAQRKQRDTRRETGSKQMIFRRTVILMVVFGILAFIPLGWKLWDIAIIHHEEYQKRQQEQSTRDVEVQSSRGTILDANGNVLAMSATVYNLILSPLDLIQSINEKDYKLSDGTTDEAAYTAAIQARRDLITHKICSVLGLDEESVSKRMERTWSQYEVIQTAVEGEQAEELLAFISENKLGYSLIMSPTTKRYYPYSSVASHIVGFVNANGGAYGIEAVYEDILEGTAGRVVTTKTASGTEIYNSYSDYIDAIDGYDVKLTIDTNIQRMAEQILAQGIEKYEIQQGGVCVVMDPDTGAILAMASSPTYDLNNYGTIYDQILNEDTQDEIRAEYKRLKAQKPKDENGNLLSDEQLLKQATNTAISAALNKQWRSKALNDTYEPGSTFKAVVLAAALEAGVVDENDTFNCPGYYMVSGTRISCSDHGGHGVQTLRQAVQNSCNPAFMMIGQKLGAEKFYDYLEDFGITEATGIDLPGEAVGQLWSREYFESAEGYLSLATASFGQRLTVSPLQLITSVAATVNGGYLVQPYVLQSISTSDGTVLEQTEPTVVRQVISQQTSRLAAEILESVVSEGTGSNAYVAGYRIGGKTGTAEGAVGTKDQELVSFVGFAPADDPEVIVLLYFDTPTHRSSGSNYGSTGYYISGGQMVAPLAGSLIADVLDYMGVERQYTESEAAAADVTVPKLTGYDLETAQKALKKKNLTYRTVGEGDTVTAQIPAVGASIPGNSTVILYMGQQAPEDQVKVPDLSGLTYDQAKEKLNELGLYLRAYGVSYYTSVVKVIEQTQAKGTLVDRGTVISARFADTTLTDTYVPLE